ncbi:TlpA disulfide reductase family protein [Capnocytophaga sp.]|uniref:TlpA family protein disulfide reductase n=1 Tax=Capnocytophaga sp. TaxID=44737 RepID=UPI0026DC0B18|nr:TlpA disulfide reductase family protein [Capnocytophaga sp.]MDO5105768.1 TlpA disulfide reductase family protein [Capnocytophaga sp.]
MKQLQLLFAFLMGSAFVNAQTKSIDLPPFGFANTQTLEIRKVTLSEKETVLEINAFFTPNYWIRVASETYLKTENQKYKIRRGDGIVPDSLFWMPQSGKASFKLVFDPIPLKTEVFDFIESGDCENCFKIYDVRLSKKQRKPTLPKEFTQKTKKTSGFSAKWQKGNVSVSGKIIGYKADLGEVHFIYPNPITGNRERIPVAVSPEGSFRITTPVYSPTSLILRSDAFYFPLVVAPNQELQVLINLPEMSRKKSQLHKNQPANGKEIYFSGFLADVNSEVYTAFNETYHNQQEIDSIAGLGGNALENHFAQQYRNRISKSNSLKINDLSKKIIHTIALKELIDQMGMLDYFLAKSYAQKNNISEEEAMLRLQTQPKRADFYDFYKEIPYNDSDVLLSPIASEFVGDLSRFRGINNGVLDIVHFLMENPKVSSDDKAVFKEFLNNQQKGNAFVQMKKLNETGMKYSDLIREEFSKRTGVDALAKIWGVEQAFLLDLIKARSFGENIDKLTPLTDADKEAIKSLPAEIQKFLTEENNKLVAQIEANKKRTGFAILDTPQTDDEQLLTEMLKPFKGKVVLIDMWATWCAPCIAANKEMEPLKAEFEDKDLVFVYLAGENSPKQTWENMIPYLKGQHYRVNKKQWAYLSKSFNSKGIPTYVIIDKHGNQSYLSVGFHGVEKIKTELLKALEK